VNRIGIEAAGGHDFLALDMAAKIAEKSMPTLRARKQASLSWEGSEWMDAYLESQDMSSTLVEQPESEAAVIAALKRGSHRATS
jgi:hypothetical protein